MSKFFQRLFCKNCKEELENENDGLLPKIAVDKLLELVETAINSKFELLESKLDQKFEKNQQSLSKNENTTIVVENKMPLSIELINNKLEMLHKKVGGMEEKVKKTLEFAEKLSILSEEKIKEQTDTIKEVLMSVVEKKKLGTASDDLKQVNLCANEDDCKKVPVNAVLKKKADTTSDDALENITVCATWKEKRFLSKTFKNLYPIDHPSLQHVNVKREGDKLTYLKMNIAVRARDYASILLSPVQNPSDDDYVFEIVLGEKKLKLSNTTKRECTDKYVKELDTDIFMLSPEKLVMYYLTIKNGVLAFSRRIDSYWGRYPLSYFDVEDANVANIKYFGFNLFPVKEHIFLFDCDSSFEGSINPVHS